MLKYIIPVPKDFQNKRLQKIIQRLKSLILQTLPSPTRAQIKTTLAKLEQAYQAKTLSFEEYKIKSLVTLCQFRSLTWTEQFLYRETGNFFTQAEKFTICQNATDQKSSPLY